MSIQDIPTGGRKHTYFVKGIGVLLLVQVTLRQRVIELQDGRVADIGNATSEIVE